MKDFFGKNKTKKDIYKFVRLDKRFLNIYSRTCLSDYHIVEGKVPFGGDIEI